MCTRGAGGSGRRPDGMSIHCPRAKASTHVPCRWSCRPTSMTSIPTTDRRSTEAAAGRAESSRPSIRLSSKNTSPVASLVEYRRQSSPTSTAASVECSCRWRSPVRPLARRPERAPHERWRGDAGAGRFGGSFVVGVKERPAGPGGRHGAGDANEPLLGVREVQPFVDRRAAGWASVLTTGRSACGVTSCSSSETPWPEWAASLLAS